MSSRSRFFKQRPNKKASLETFRIPRALLLTAAILSPHAALQAAPVQIVIGDSEIQGNQTVTGKQTVSGGQDVTGKTQLNGDLNVTGDTNLKGLTVDGNQTVTGGQTVGGNSQINGGLTVKQWLVVGPPPPVPVLPGELWVDGKRITSGGGSPCPTGSTSSVCLGTNATATGENATAVGSNANSVSGGTAIGARSRVTGVNGTAIGIGATAGDPGTAVGAFAEATGENASAFGANAKATGKESLAIGTGASATFDNSSAIGAGAQTTRANQVVIGTKGTSLTLPGVANGGTFSGRTNQSGLVRVLTTDGTGNVGTSFDPDALQNTTSNLEQAVDSLGQAVTSAGAIAAAFTAVPQMTLGAQEPIRCGAGLGGYGSSYAVAMGCAARLSKKYPDVSLNAAISLTNSVDYVYGSTPSFAGRVGFSFPLGKKREQSQTQAANTAPDPQLAERVEILQQQVQQLQYLLQRQASPAPNPAPSGQLIRGLW
jgi:autotransporter adhesin